jgi:hypothetical protein
MSVSMMSRTEFLSPLMASRPCHELPIEPGGPAPCKWQINCAVRHNEKWNECSTVNTVPWYHWQLSAEPARPVWHDIFEFIFLFCTMTD